MRSIMLSPFIIKVFNNLDNEYIELDKLPDGRDFFFLFTEFVNSITSEYRQNDETQTMFKIQRPQSDGRIISGIFSKGDYGYSNNLVNKNDFSLVYQRDEDDAEMEPFYFVIACPENSDEAILLTEKKSVRTITGLFSNEIKAFFRLNEPDIKIEFSKLIPSNVIDSYLGRGVIQKIRFIRYIIPSDFSNALHLGHEEIEGTTEIQVIAKRNNHLPIFDLIVPAIRRNVDIKQLISIPDFEYNDVKVEFDIEGHKRVLSISNPDNLKAEYDITDEIEINGGHPTFDSINRIARNYLLEIITDLGLQNNNV
jgi:hypothetical protein